MRIAYYPERIIQLKNAERSGKTSAGVSHTSLAAASREVSLEAVQSGEINVNSLTEAEKRDILKKAIDSGQITTKLNHEKQAPHIFGSEMYDPKRNKSYFTISQEELQTLVNERMGTGKVFISKSGEIREMIEIDGDIGVCMKQDGSGQHITNRFTIHYSKKRTHIVPSNGKR